MVQYIGESSTAPDEKGRIMVPAQMRSIMDANDHDIWFITRGFDNALFLFEKDTWNKLLSQAKPSAMLDPAALDFRRMFLGSAAKVKRDNQGRMLIPAPLREYAGIKGEAVLIGVEDHLELWSKERWQAFQESQAQKYKAMAADFFGPAESKLAPAAATAEGESDHAED